MSFILDKNLFFKNLFVIYHDTNNYTKNFMDELLENNKIKILDDSLLDKEYEDTFDILYISELNVKHIMTVIRIMYSEKGVNLATLAENNVTNFYSTNKKPEHYENAKKLFEEFKNQYMNIGKIDEIAIIYLAGFFN